MLIPIQYISWALATKFSSILHVGAHLGEEMTQYLNSGNGTSEIVWIESEYELCLKLRAMINDNPFKTNQEVIHATIWSEDGIEKNFYTSNHSMSNSVLQPKLHLEAYPEIKFNSIETKVTKKLDTLLHLRKFDLINLDIQGAELEALKGFSLGMQNGIKLIYTEVNRKELYVGCSQLNDVIEYLTKCNFSFIGVVWENSGWGDAIFLVDNGQFSHLRIFVLKVLIRIVAFRIALRNFWFTLLRQTIRLLRSFLTKIRIKKISS